MRLLVCGLASCGVAWVLVAAGCEAKPIAIDPGRTLAPSLRLLSPGDTLLPGDAATGTSGDYLLSTADGRVRFVIGGPGHKEGFQLSGGNLLDLSLDGRPDALDGISTWFEREFPRQAVYTRWTQDGDALVVTGADSGDPQILVETRWESIDPPLGVIGTLKVSTTVTSTKSMSAYDLGDIIGWGGLRHFAPGPGFDLKGTDEALPWIGAEAEDHAVLLVGEGPVSGPHGASWSDPVWDSTDLHPATPLTYTRTLHVGETLAALLSATGARRRVRVESRETGTDASIPGARFLISRDGLPFAVGRTDATGSLTMSLPRGPFGVTLNERGRRAGAASLLDEGSDRVVARASPEGWVQAKVTNGERPIPARLTFFGLEGTPTPDLGPSSRAVGGNRANLSSPGSFAVPPGTYRVVASQGPFMSRAESRLVVPEGTVDLHLALRELVSSKGWLQCDLHQHAAYSPDSAIPPVDGVIASVAEGLNCIATTEHDAVADWSQHISDAALTEPLLWLSGIEVTSSDDGHYNVYPWDPSLGTIEHLGLDPFQITEAIRSRAPGAVLQVNHPRHARIGAYNRLESAEAISRLDVDAIELLNGKSVDDAEVILHDVARLLGRGVRAALVGASDSHHLVDQERGSARTFVHVGSAPPTADTVSHALRQRRSSTASNGPLLHLTTQNGVVIADLRTPDWMQVSDVTLYSGPFGGAHLRGLPEPVATWAIQEAPVAGQVHSKWQYTPPESAPRWYLAVARGTEPMEPWMNVPAWAATSPVILP